MCMDQQNQPQGISVALKHARNFTQAFGFLFLPRALPHVPWCWFCEASQGQLLGLLTSQRGCLPAPWPAPWPPLKISFSQLQNHGRACE